jgi:4-hydroxy 2-oxovalerate aldolase
MGGEIEMKEILMIDSTLRDGSHAKRHRFTEEEIRSYAAAAEQAGVKILVAGHGNGLGASTLQIGKSLVSDDKFLRIAKNELRRTKLGVLIIPGVGSIKEDLEPALRIGAEVVFVTCHCTEADTTQKYIQYASKQGKEAIGVLMMTHMLDAEGLLAEALKMQEYGASGVLLMDSAGALLPKDVAGRVSLLVKGLKIKVGFHAHNNLGMATANSLAAVEAGAHFIDATSRGFGAGAGNGNLEVIAVVLQKSGFETGLDLYKLMDMSDNVTSKFSEKPPDINGITITSGLAGVFSGFCPIVVKTAQKFGVDPRDILMELGRRKIVAGQEDYITQIAVELASKKQSARRD